MAHLVWQTCRVIDKGLLNSTAFLYSPNPSFPPLYMRRVTSTVSLVPVALIADGAGY